MQFIIFTDGASRGNPGNGGWGAIIEIRNTKNEIRELGGREDNTTNNRMEMKAAIQALTTVTTITSFTTIELYTDSAYLINGITKWVHGWQENNWKTKTKKEVQNVDLWQELVKVSQGKQIEWKRISGHSGIPANERCDQIATAFADGKSVALFNGDASQYKVDLQIKSQKSKVESKNRKKSFAYSYVSQVNGKIETHKTWKECEARVKGVSGARFKKAVSAEDEKEIIAEFS